MDLLGSNNHKPLSGDSVDEVLSLDFYGVHSVGQRREGEQRRKDAR